MSGPKDYSPPPRYSMQVFDGKLNQIFQLQSRLKMLRSEIDELHLIDTKLNIQFDCKNELDKIRKQIEIMLNPVVFNYKGNFGQETYNKIQKEFELRISELLKTLNVCGLMKSDFDQKKSDYNMYLSYLKFYENSCFSFIEFKNQIIQYIKSNIETNAPELFKEANEKINLVEFTKTKSDFYFGFESKIDQEKNLINEQIIEKEKKINSIRAEVSGKVIEKFHRTGAKIKFEKHEIIVPEASNIIVEKIKILISNCDDMVMRKKYKAELDKLIKSESMKDPYFYKELHDSIFDSEKSRKVKMEINRILSELNILSIHPYVKTDKQNLINLCLSLLKKSNVIKSELTETSLKMEQLKSQSNKYYEEDEIRFKEHLFLKSQLVLCLENQGYEVMDDLEVIDFEKENDFLLKIKGQENYLNLKFKDDGSMRYVFQIPEKKEELSTDQINMKLHEMEVTCSEFQSILKDLSKMGLKVNMRSEKPIELDTIVSITKINNEKLKMRKKSQQQQQIRKKYLN